MKTQLFALVVGLAVAWPFSTPAWAAPSAVVTTPQVRAELVAHAPEGIAPGKPMWLGLKIEHQPHWHTYWKNPGDSGLPTTLDWKLPSNAQGNLTLGDIQWPTPSRLPIGPLMNYGFEGTLLLPVPLSLKTALTGDTLEVQLRADWLVCKDVCIPEGGDFVLRLPLQASSAGQAALFAAAQTARPQTAASVRASAIVQGSELHLRVGPLPAAWQGQTLRFFPELPGLIQNAAVPVQTWNGTDWSARIPLDPQRSDAPPQIPAVLTLDAKAAGAGGGGSSGSGGNPGGVQATGLAIQISMKGAWPAAAGAAAPAVLPALVSPSAASADRSNPGADGKTRSASNGMQGSTPTPAGLTALLGALLFALAGGALLNLMPCVFPVLSLKVLGFASHAHDRRGLLVGGLAYTAGVVMSFVALAALLLALRAGGEQLGWGFQLQSPLVVAGLAALFTLIGLNLLGVFETGSLLPSSWASARARHPAADAGLTGVLAVAVASPCTAPFMGAALGLALGLPAWQALLIFAALGLGMAAPYLAASAWPALARALPRPGVWMVHFKTVMAFPMFATVVWLLWVLGQQVGIDSVAALLLLLLVLAFAAWSWGSPQLGPRGRAGFGGVALVLLVATSVWAWPALRQGSTPAAVSNSASHIASNADLGSNPKIAAEWQPWSSARVAQAQAAGQPVFVDFTAAWCVTCQFNKRTTLADADVQALFAQKRVLLLRADWTRRDPAISAELSALQRSGVPVYALYTPGQAGPRLLSEILSVDEMRSALNPLPNPG